MTSIGNIELGGKLILAPMAGVSDLAFRRICFEQGAALTVTEMVSARALMYQDGKTKTLLENDPVCHPFAAQIFGSEPEIMADAAVKAREISGADIIDINMGCPVGKIVNNGEGSALMKDIGKARSIIEAVVSKAGCPVTVKFRKGWDKGNVNAIDFALMCRDAGASAIAVHGRTRTQMYEGKADWDIIRDVKCAVGDFPVIANGDIWEGQDAEHILRYTGCDFAMIARGCFGNPWIFAQGNAALKGEAVPEMPPLSERVDTAIRQFELAARYKSEKIACLEARRHFAWYLRGVPHSGYFKQQIVKIETLDDARSIAERIKTELG